jgi:exopolysaccharide biosynthesis polyprenyl glycosylphosphotransferase
VSTISAIYDRLDERTLELLEHRRTAGGLRRRGWLVRRALLAADLIGLSSAFLVATLAFGVGDSHTNHLGAAGEYALFFLALPAWVVAAKLYGLYDKDEERTDHSTTDDFSGVFHLVTVTSWIIFAVAYLTPVAKPSFGKVLTFWAVATAVIPLARATGRAMCRRNVNYLQNTAIIGAGEVGQSLARKLLRHPEYGVNLVGFVDGEPREPDADLEHLALLGDPSDLPELVQLLDIERVIFAFSNERHAEMLELIRTLGDMNVQVDVVPRFFEVIGGGFDVHTVEGLPVIGLPPFRLPRSSRLLKRALDVAGASFGLLVLSPLFAIVALLIRTEGPGPVFFRQVRMGAGDKLFEIVKFRTMVMDADLRKAEFAHLNKHAQNGSEPQMFKIDGDPRVTKLGRVLRRYSLDELPQLWNVLRGDMSLIGPRPLILDEHAHVSGWAGRRLDLRPGISGLWQVLGSDDIPFAEMVKLDYLYVTSWSLGGDIQLLLRSFPAVFRRGV